MRIGQPLKWYGGKYYLAPKIIALMPKHSLYAEHYFGGGAVLLCKPPSEGEVVNDLHRELINFWRVLQHEESFAQLVRSLQATPHSEEEFARAMESGEQLHEIERARRFFIRARQSYSGNCSTYAGVSKRIRGHKTEASSAWLTAIDGLPAVHARLRGVQVINRDAIDSIRTCDGVETLHYCDPPYLLETRVSGLAYEHEMTTEQHTQLLLRLLECRGKVMLSGYRSTLYDTLLSGWTRHDFTVNSGESRSGRTECLWCNYATQA